MLQFIHCSHSCLYLAIMDLLLSHLIFFMLFLLPYSSFAQNKSRVEVGATITASDKAAPWLSPSHDFAFGFRKLDEQNLFLLSIWFYKIPDQTVVWYANEGIPVSAGSRVVLNPEMGLVLYDPRGNQLWKPNNLLNAIAYGSMSDTGNFMLLRGDSSPEWESFNYPTDTMLPTQIMQSGGVLNSRKSENNFSSGRFQFRLLADGNLVLNTRDVQSNMAYQAYYQSGTNDPSNSSNSGYQVVFNQMAQMYILRKNNQSMDLTPNSPPLVENYYHRATLNFDGVFGQYYHPKSSSKNPGWNIVWQQPDNICLENTPTEGSGTCGFNSICQLNINQRPICQCPQHYELLDPNDEYGSCKPRFTLSCEEDNSNKSAEDLYGFEELINIDWPNNDYVQMNPTTEMECRTSCLYDCFCAIATFDSGNCWKKRQPLANGRKYPKVNGILKVFLKYKKVDMLP
ncbi:Non-specific serine/threonine protein kinase [Bertholletia excelsa]